MKKYDSHAEQVEAREGFRAYIVIDNSPESPRTAYDNVGRMVSFHDRDYSWGDEQLGADALTRQGGGKEVRREALRRAYRRFEGAAVFLWIEHSSYDSSLRVTADADNSAGGFIYCTREQVKKEWGETTDAEGKTPAERAESYLRGEVETASQWATGDVWGVRIENAEGEEVYATWGHYGREYAEAVAREELAREIAWEAEEVAIESVVTATCPACGHTGPEAQDFSWLAAGFNGVEAGDEDDVDMLECGQCGHRFDPDREAEPFAPTWGSAETVAGLRNAATLLGAEEGAERNGILFPAWVLEEEDEGDEGPVLIRDAARAILGAHGLEGGMHTSKKALAALVHYVADMLEE